MFPQVFLITSFVARGKRRTNYFSNKAVARGGVSQSTRVKREKDPKLLKKFINFFDFLRNGTFSLAGKNIFYNIITIKIEEIIKLRNFCQWSVAQFLAKPLLVPEIRVQILAGLLSQNKLSY